MNEEPKSIWKKPFHLPQMVGAWLGLIMATMFILLVVKIIINEPFEISWLMIFGAVSATVLLAGWIFIRWLCCWRNFKRSLFALACLATLIALFYAEEDWRGWHAWNQFKHEWQAKGEHFDMAGVTPAPVPDEQNFAMTPIAFTGYGSILTRDGKRIPYEQRDTNFVERIKMSVMSFAHDGNGPTNVAGNREKGRFTNLKGWQNYYRDLATKTNEFAVPAQPQSPAADVLLALSKFDPVIEELRAASRLPDSRFPLQYTNESPAAILLPHLALLKQCTQVLQIRSLAELQNSQPDKALADVTLALQLTDKIRTEPFLISHLVRIAMLQIMLQPVWEGLAEHRWSDTQLVALDAELAKLDFLPDYKLSMHGEMGMQGGEMDRLRRHPEQLQDMGSFYDDEGNGRSPSLPGGLSGHLIPTGWFYQNQFRCARVMVEFYIPVADVSQGTFSPELARRGDGAVRSETKSVSPFNILERMLLPELGAAAKKFAYAQASVDLARTAIALERYRLAHGEYPEALDVLAPQFIAKVPHDVIGGQPLKYRRESDGQFLLYSVGWNEKDDGGVVEVISDVKITDGNGVKGVDNGKGDWVWRYPAK